MRGVSGIFYCFLLVVLSAQYARASKEALLDKILAVFNEKVVTLSEIKRMQQNIHARRKIAPQIYRRTKYSTNELAVLRIRIFLIREELSRIGYVIDNDRVESQIKESERKIGIGREQLLDFLSKNRMSFDEYFELTRESIEYQIFSSRIIAPLISVTEQEVKNAFYKENAKDKTLTFKYNLVDFSLEKKLMTKEMLRTFRDVLIQFQTKGILPERFSKMKTTVLGDITEDGLTKRLIKILKNIKEGHFTRPILLGEDYHVFLVKKKSMVESELFIKAKRNIQHSLTERSAEKIVSDWFEREQKKHYVVYSF